MSVEPFVIHFFHFKNISYTEYVNKFIIFKKWHKLYLYINQMRNDYNDCNIYYKLLMKNGFKKWNRLHITKSTMDCIINNILNNKMNVNKLN